MSEPFIGQIKMFAGGFSIRSFAFCDGQQLPIAQNTALFSILGTTFGGDGRTTVGLPDLQGRLAIGDGRGAGLTPRRLGEKLGTDEVVLNAPQLGAHTHTMNGTNQNSNWYWPGLTALARSTRGNSYAVGETVAMDSSSISNSGGDGSGGVAPHDNVQPAQVVTYLIALQGLFPSRS